MLSEEQNRYKKGCGQVILEIANGSGREANEQRKGAAMPNGVFGQEHTDGAGREQTEADWGRTIISGLGERTGADGEADGGAGWGADEDAGGVRTGVQAWV